MEEQKWERCKHGEIKIFCQWCDSEKAPRKKSRIYLLLKIYQ